jgi:hypothetical protein
VSATCCFTAKSRRNGAESRLHRLAFGFCILSSVADRTHTFVTDAPRIVYELARDRSTSRSASSLNCDSDRTP